jgi:sentrin-specific protease 7
MLIMFLYNFSNQEEVQESCEKKDHLEMDIQKSTGHEIETLRKEGCMLYIEDSDDEEAVSVEYVSDSQDSYEVEMKVEDDDDDELIVTGESSGIHGSREIKSDSASIERVNKSRDSTAASCYNDFLLVLSDDERSSDDKENILISSNVMAKPKT